MWYLNATLSQGNAMRSVLSNKRENWWKLRFTSQYMWIKEHQKQLLLLFFYQISMLAEHHFFRQRDVDPKDAWGLFYSQKWTDIRTWISNPIHSFLWGVIIHQLLIVITLKIRLWVSNDESHSLGGCDFFIHAQVAFYPRPGCFISTLRLLFIHAQVASGNLCTSRKVPWQRMINSAVPERWWQPNCTPVHHDFKCILLKCLHRDAIFIAFSSEWPAWFKR